MRHAVLAMATGAAALLLQGCAAAVFPVVAGIAMTRPQIGSSPKAPQPEEKQRAVQIVSLTELPPPDFVTRATDLSIESFRTYALKAALPGLNRRSAILADGADMSLSRTACKPGSPAVFIDLDPGRASFDPLSRSRAAPGLVQTLADLREAGVEIVWFSRLSDNFAAPVQAALAQSGLDSAGGDRVVLMRNLDERKQTRRDELAAEMCPIAMLGDERADFDELFLYLKQPQAAIALEPMIGQGWFLTSPIEPDLAPPQAGAQP
ncbi:hypothetical protein [Qipengyuania sp.]|uniref:hypothetical protein n=1 Tax=Qipengyuania sp. TaxID=2004515 RepID=UPI0035C825CF